MFPSSKNQQNLMEVDQDNQTTSQQLRLSQYMSERCIIYDKDQKSEMSDQHFNNDQLKQSQGNSVQPIDCMKYPQERMNAADSMMFNQQVVPSSYMNSLLTRNESLLNCMKHLQGNGQTQGQQSQMHPNLYVVKGAQEIPVKVQDDSKYCNCFGCCLVDDNTLLVTDYNNKKLKRVDISNVALVDYCILEAMPVCVCCISKQEVAIACEKENSIQFVSIQKEMTPSRQIKVFHKCYGIAYNEDKLYLTDQTATIYVHDMTGTLLRTISLDNTGSELVKICRHITFNKTGNRMFVGCGCNEFAQFDEMENCLSTTWDNELRTVDGVCIDGRGSIFVVGLSSQNVVQFSEDGEKICAFLKGLSSPRSICFHLELNLLFVTNDCADVVKMYKLEQPYR